MASWAWSSGNISLSLFYWAISSFDARYIAAGKHDKGNPYGLAAVFAVCFPLIFYAMQYWPIPPLTLIISFITAVLVVGFSYQDARQPPAPNTAGVGFTVAWVSESCYIGNFNWSSIKASLLACHGWRNHCIVKLFNIIFVSSICSQLSTALYLIFRHPRLSADITGNCLLRLRLSWERSTVKSFRLRTQGGKRSYRRLLRTYWQFVVNLKRPRLRDEMPVMR